MRPTTSVSLLALLLLTVAVSRDLAAAPARSAPATEKRDEMPSWVVGGDWMPSEEEAVQDALTKSRTKLVEYLRSQNPPMSWVPDGAYVRQRLWTNLNAGETRFKALGWKHAQETVMGDGVWLRAKSWNELLDAGIPPAVIDKLKGMDRKTFATRDECRAALETVLDKDEMQRYQKMILDQANGNAFTVQMETQDLGLDVGRMYRAAVRVEVSPLVRPDFAQQERTFQESLRQHRASHRQTILAWVLGALVAVLLAVAGYLAWRTPPRDITRGDCLPASWCSWHWPVPQFGCCGDGLFSVLNHKGHKRHKGHQGQLSLVSLVSLVSFVSFVV